MTHRREQQKLSAWLRLREKGREYGRYRRITSERKAANEARKAAEREG